MAEDQTTQNQAVTAGLGSQEGVDKKISQPKGKFPTIRTLKLDTAEYVKKGNVSLADIAVEQAKADRSGLTGRTEESSTGLLFVSIILVLILVGAGVGGWIYYKRGQDQAPVGTLVKTILVAEDQVEIIATRKESLLEEIGDAFGSQVRINHLLNISIIEPEGEIDIAISSKTFFELIEVKPPAKLLDFLDSKFMIAKFYLSEDWPVLILKTESYDNAFVGMIEWEKNITDDLEDIFLLKEDGQRVAGSFTDKEIKGHDVRVLEKEDGGIFLAYSFVNRKYLIITTGREPLEEMFRRFSSTQYLNE